MILKGFVFHHIGIATGNIEKTTTFYLEAGYSCTSVIPDPIQNVSICFLTREASPLIELVSPLTEDSPVSKIIQSTGVTPYHTCYEVVNIEISIKLLKQMGFLPIFKPVPAIALKNRLICFLYNKNFGLIELLQSK